MKVLSYLSVLLSFKQNPSVGTGLFLPLKFGQFQQKTTKVRLFWGIEPHSPRWKASVQTTTPRLHCYKISCKLMKWYMKSDYWCPKKHTNTMKKISDMPGNWTQVACVAGRCHDHYTMKLLHQILLTNIIQCNVWPIPT